MVDEEIEIWAQRVGNISGSGLLGAAKRVSNAGPDGDANFDAFRPEIIYNEGQNRYLVVWHGDNNLNGCVNDEFEIWGQHLDEFGEEIDSDFVISAMGGYGNILSFAMEPALAYNSAAGHYLITWHGSTVDAPAPDEMEIYGRIINAASGETVTPDFRISSVGPDGDLGFIGAFPDAAFDPASNTYLVVWFGDDAASDKYDIYGQHLNANGDLVGDEGFPLSSMGSPLCGTSCGARDPAIAYASGENEFLVVWYGVDDTPPMVEHELEIFGQRYATPASLSGRIFLPMTVRAH